MKILTVPSHYANTVINAAIKHGCDRDTILKENGIAAELLEQEKTRIPASTFSNLTNRLTLQLEDEYCGLLSSRCKPGTFAMMCHACINCATLGQFLNRSAEFTDLVNESFKIEIARDGEFVSYRIIPTANTSSDEIDLVTQISLGIAHRLAGWAVGQTVKLESVSIQCKRPSHASEYNFLFLAPIVFDQEYSALIFKSTYLDMPIVQNEQSLEKFLSTPSMQLMSSVDTGRSLVSKVKLMIQDDVSGQFPEFETVANSLHFTTATLRRRLRTEGSSYQQIKDDIRRDTAIYHLSKGTLSMDQVAESIGFSEPTSFFRAFKRWTGVTPRAYVK